MQLLTLSFLISSSPILIVCFPLTDGKIIYSIIDTGSDSTVYDKAAKEFYPDDITIDEVRYTITPDGSNSHHCTPEILGPMSNRILSLDYSNMRLVGIEIRYVWIADDGICVPRLTLQFRDNKHEGWGLFSINCNLHSGYLSPETKELPDLNALTPFSENS